MSKLRTTVAQWGLVSGIRQESSDLIVSVPSPSRFTPEARKGQLVVVVEAEGDVSRGRNACTLVANTIREVFYSDGSVSITSSLRKALKAANAALYQFNFDAPQHKRATVGATCAVFHGHDLFVTQVPPAQAYVAHAGKLRGVPNPPAWTGGAQGGAAVGYSAALGTSLGSEAEFFRSVLQPGDTVVLTSSNIARLLSRSQAEQLICFSDAATVAEGLYELCHRSHLPEAHAVVVEIIPELSPEARSSPLSAAGVSERGKLAVERVGEWFQAVGSEARSTIQRRQADAPPGTPVEHEEVAVQDLEEMQQPVSRDTYSDAPFIPAPAPIPKGNDAGAAEATAGGDANGGTLLDRVPVGDPEPLPLSAFIGEGNYGGVVRPPAIKRDHRIDLSDNHGVPVDFAALPKKAAPPPPGLVETVTLPIRGMLVHLLGGMANVPKRTVRPLEGQPRPIRAKVRGLSYRRERPPIPWLNIIVITGVVVLLVAVGLLENRRRDQGTVDKALGNVAQAVQAAEAATAEPEAQQHLREADTALAALAPLRRSGLLTETKTQDWGRYQEVLRHYDQARSSINRIGLLDNFVVAARLPNTGAQASRVVLATDPATVTGLLEDRMFVLDRGNDGGTVYQRNGKGLEPVLAPGQTAGTVVAGKIHELLWRDDNPLALDRDENPFNSIATAYLRGTNGWLANRLQGSELLPLGDIPAASFAGNLYLWDTKQHQLMKYGSGQYGDLPTPWITQPGAAKLDQVTGVQIDGDIYLLLADGSVAVFRGGAFQRTLPAPKLSVPIQTITRFYVTPNVVDEKTGTVSRPGSIYLLDTLNERVIQIAKTDGSVIQQLQAREHGPLNRMMDLVVDAARGNMYLANGQTILRAHLPTPPVRRVTTATPGVTATAQP